MPTTPLRPLHPLRALSRPALALLLAAALAGCHSLQTNDNFLGIITPYRLEIVQGNVITREAAARIVPGQSRAQVRDILGTPLVADPFHADRWDYVFAIRRQGAPTQLRRVVVTFKDDALASIDTGGELPSERDFVASIDTLKPRKPPALALTEEQIKRLPTPPEPAASAPAVLPPIRSYPPLEPTS